MKYGSAASGIFGFIGLWAFLLMPRMVLAAVTNYGEGDYSLHSYGGGQPLVSPVPGADNLPVTGAIMGGLIALGVVFIGGLVMVWVMRRQRRRMLGQADQPVRIESDSSR